MSALYVIIIRNMVCPLFKVYEIRTKLFKYWLRFAFYIRRSLPPFTLQLYSHSLYRSLLQSSAPIIPSPSSSCNKQRRLSFCINTCTERIYLMIYSPDILSYHNLLSKTIIHIHKFLPHFFYIISELTTLLGLLLLLNSCILLTSLIIIFFSSL